MTCVTSHNAYTSNDFRLPLSCRSFRSCRPVGFRGAVGAVREVHDSDRAWSLSEVTVGLSSELLSADYCRTVGLCRTPVGNVTVGLSGRGGSNSRRLHALPRGARLGRHPRRRRACLTKRRGRWAGLLWRAVWGVWRAGGGRRGERGSRGLGRLAGGWGPSWRARVACVCVSRR